MMKKTKKKLSFLLFACLLFSLFVPTAYAQNNKIGNDLAKELTAINDSDTWCANIRLREDARLRELCRGRTFDTGYRLYCAEVIPEFIALLPDDIEITATGIYSPVISVRATKADILKIAKFDQVAHMYAGAPYVEAIVPLAGIFVNEEVKGDINTDGTVNSQDARIALRAAAKLVALDEAQTARGDMNGDGKVNSVDARILLRMAANLAG